MKHVKENDLVHGEWSNWCESIGMDRSNANKFIRIYEELGGTDVVTSPRLGMDALYMIAQLPLEERDKPHTTSKGEQKTPSEMTVRELRQLKADLKRAEEQRRQAEQQAELERKERERLEALASDVFHKKDTCVAFKKYSA